MAKKAKADRRKAVAAGTADDALRYRAALAAAVED